MKSQSFKVHLKSEVSVGSPGTVNGGRDSIDYLQGGLFLGAAAARLYTTLGDDAWTVFHSGKVRFSDALPLAPSGLTAFPTPQSLAQKKHEPTVVKDVFQASELINLAFQQRSVNLDKVTAPYISSAGEKVRPQTQYRLKTAIDPHTGGSMDRRLYGYHSLLPDQTYHFRLEADDDVADDLLHKILAALQKPMRLGRSLTAEYGRVEVEPCDTELPAPVLSSNGYLTLLLCSHLVVEDEGGVTPALPEAHQLGLPAGELVPERCFVRHAWHSIYNGAYRAFESDLPVITRGSVLCYAMSAENQAKVSSSPTYHGGLQQQRGFGCMLVNPAFLVEKEIKLKASYTQTKKTPVLHSNHPLASWLKRRVTSRKAEADVRSLAESWYQELVELYDSARIRGGFTADMVAGPTPSQWGRISEVVTRQLTESTNLAQLEKKLFDPAKNAQDHGRERPICSINDPDWSKVIVHEALERTLGRPPHFADWLQAKLAGEPSVSHSDQPAASAETRIRALIHFARFAADRAKQQRHLEEENHA